MPGTVTTFYSHADTGIWTDQLVAVAEQLADWGHRVLCVDWNLERATLSRRFELADRGGLQVLIEGYGYRPIPVGTRLSLLPAGVYQVRDWPALYRERRFADVVERWRERWCGEFDFVLVDCMGGVGPEAAICLAQLPDQIVLLADKPGIEVVARANAARDRMPYDRPQFRVVPYPFDPALVGNWLDRRVRPDTVRPSTELVAALIARRFARTDLLGDSAAYVAGARRSIRKSVELSDTAGLVGEVLHWQLPPDRWATVNQTVSRMRLALMNDDIDLLAELTGELELAGPVRDTHGTGVPASVRQLVVELVARLNEGITA
jgi:hypothetical protein